MRSLGELLQFSDLDSFVYICIISKQWSGSEGQFTDTGSQGRSFIAKDVGVLEQPKTPQTQSSLKFAGDDSVILISACVSASLRFRFPT